MRKLSRRTLLAISAATSLALHGALIFFSPMITVITAEHEPPAPLRFRIQLLDEVVDFTPPALEHSASLASRPGSIEDLIARPAEQIEPGQGLAETPVDVPQLTQRAAADPVLREYDLSMNEELIKTVDAKIIEIAQETARRDIQIARRLVRPSSTRIVQEGEYPLLRKPLDELDSEILLPDPLSIGPVPPSAETETAPAGEAKPAPPEPGLEPISLALDEGLPELPPEPLIARAPAERDAQRNRPYEFMDDLLDIQLETYVPPGAPHGYFRLQIVPKDTSAIEPLPKDINFVIDASSSILQRKLDLTVQGVAKSLEALRPDDRFNIVVFRDTPREFQPAPVFATPSNIAQARDFLKGLQSRGQTNVYEAIRPVVYSNPREGIPGIVVVVTDGRPTAGLRDGRDIINSLTDENALTNSIFAFGGGRTVNRYLLDLLAYRNKGESYVSEVERMSAELPRFVSKLSDPLLVNCRADFGQLDSVEIYPKILSDFYRGAAVTIYGQYDPVRDKEFVLRLTGHAGPKEKEVIFRADIEKAARGAQDIVRHWAFRKVYHLIGEICRLGETPELMAQVRELSKRYQIRTSYSE